MSPPIPRIPQPWLEALLSRPLRSFGSVGALGSCLGALMLGVVVCQHLSGNNAGLYARPLFLIAVLLLVLGVQIIGLWAAALILGRLSHSIRNP